MLDLGKLYIPTIIDYSEDRSMVSFAKPEFLTDDYINNLECFLSINFSGSDIFLDYYCDNDTNLLDNLGLTGGYAATGDLTKESFENIQRRALEKLSEFMDDPRSQILDDYN